MLYIEQVQFSTLDLLKYEMLLLIFLLLEIVRLNTIEIVGSNLVVNGDAVTN